jgi:hypothetical protein
MSIFSSTLSILIAGGLLAFLIFAFPPQKIMTGSAGKSVYGFLICILALVADARFQQLYAINFAFNRLYLCNNKETSDIQTEEYRGLDEIKWSGSSTSPVNESKLLQIPTSTNRDVSDSLSRFFLPS